MSDWKKHFSVYKDYFFSNNTYFLCQMYYPHLQEDNGLPIHIKGGTTDVLLYRLTMAITVAGTKPYTVDGQS